MFNSINKSLIIFIPLFSFIVFSSLSFYWVKAPYDAWRIYEILLLIFANILGIQLIFQQKYQIIDIKFDKNISLIISILVFIILISAANSHYPPRAYADASLYFLLFSACIIYAYLFKKYYLLTNQIIALVAVLPLLTLIFLPIAIWDRLNGGIGSWTQSFTNIRMLDDALLPCLFLLWLRTGFLKNNEDSKRIKNWILTIFLYTISTIYLLNFLFHGARACLLSIFIGLVIIFIHTNKNSLHSLKLPIISSVIAITLYISYHQILPNLIGSSLARSDSSGRIDLWLKSLKIWYEHPFIGVGGNHFLLQEPYTVIAHPHNIWLKFLSEWGAAVFIFTGLLYLIFNQIKSRLPLIPPILIGGTVAIFINSILSGSLIYPVSQITSLCILAYALSFCLNPNTTPSNKNSSKYLWILLIVLFSSIILIVHGQDIFCINCISIDFEGAPAFWDSGRPLHLEPYVTDHSGQTNNRY